MAWQKVFVRTIYGTSRTRDGIYLAGRMGMETIEELSDTHRKVFVLDMGTNQTRWGQEYRAYLETLDLPTDLTSGILNGKPLNGDHAEKADSKSNDSKTARKPHITRDASGQNGTERKTPTRSTNHLTKP